MAGYGWDEYDVRTGGRQTIHDAGNFIDITTSFVKIPGGNNGGSWAARIKGVPREDAPAELKTTIIFSAALEGLGKLEVADNPEPYGYEGDVTLKGNSDGLGDYKLVVTKGTGGHPSPTHQSYDGKPLDRTIVNSMVISEEHLWQMKQWVFMKLKEEIDVYLNKYGQENAPPPWQVYTVSNNAGFGNLHLIQKVFEGPFEFDVLFSSASAEKEVTSEEVTQRIETNAQSFSERFRDIFKLTAPFNQPKYEEFAKNMFSNLFGGIGYFYGDSIVDRSYALEYDEENEGFWEETAEARARRQERLEGPSQLFTSIPSRPFFPRGFLWDEGFHLLPIADWDMDATLEIVKSWFNLMDEDGWIGREQILGMEARSKVPPEFQVQYPHYANPPTLFLILETFIDRLIADNGTKSSTIEEAPSIQTAHLQSPEIAYQYLRNIYPLLKRQYDWFRRTQSGDLKSYDRNAFSTREAYRWRGRTPQHILTSGLDDYPRPQPPHPGELHVDLISWMGMMTKSLRRIASYIGANDDAAEYANSENAILHNIDDLHWSTKEGAFCDATIDEYEENVLVCHKGYVSIFPFLLGLLPVDSPKLGSVLDLLANEEELWSEHGIRSLSKSDEFYETGENYWRGPIWININYLAVRELLVRLVSFSQHKFRSLFSNPLPTAFLGLTNAI
jgi:mannosyl-oligosaccharide glucosidase